MAEFECFHVSRQLPYSPAAQFAVGETFEVGLDNNPFFQFYERTRQYTVEAQHGHTITYPAISFLKAVRAGEIYSEVLPNIAVEIAEHYLMLARELVYDEVRRDVNNQLPSRKKCLWATDGLDEARDWHQFLGGSGRILRLSVVGDCHIADSNLLVADSEPLSATYQKAFSYWRGDLSLTPRMEMLVSGQVTVLQII